MQSQSTTSVFPVEVKKGFAPSKLTKNFRVLAKYKMPIRRGVVIEKAECMCDER